VKLWLTEDQQDLIKSKIDVAIRLGNLDEPSLAVRRLWDGSPRLLLASPEYLRRHPPISQPSELARHNCLTYLDGRSDDGRALWRFFRGYVLKAGFRDGYPGLYVATVNAFAVFARHARLYEAERGRPPPDLS
jgi:hypothetical protein